MYSKALLDLSVRVLPDEGGGIVGQYIAFAREFDRQRGGRESAATPTRWQSAIA